MPLREDRVVVQDSLLERVSTVKAVASGRRRALITEELLQLRNPPDATAYGTDPVPDFAGKPASYASNALVEVATKVSYRRRDDPNS